MSGQPTQGRIDAMEAISAGWRFAPGRAGAVLLWALIGLTTTAPALWFLMAALAGRLPTFWPNVLVGLLIWGGLVSLLQASAAMRSVLRPEDRAPGYLRLSHNEWGLLSMGWSRNPNSWPLGAILGVIVLIAFIVTLQVLLVSSGAGLRTTINIALGAFLAILIAYIGIRASLAPVAAHTGWPDAQGEAWQRSGKQIAPIAVMQVGSHLAWMTASALVAVGTWFAIGLMSGLGDPLAYFAANGSGSWRDLLRPAPLLAAFGLSLIGALHSALCVRPAARAWQMLVGDRRTRNVLADVTG